MRDLCIFHILTALLAVWLRRLANCCVRDFWIVHTPTAFLVVWLWCLPRGRQIRGSIPACGEFFLGGRVIPVTSRLVLEWPHCQAPGVIGSALGLVGPVSVYCDWVRYNSDLRLLSQCGSAYNCVSRSVHLARRRTLTLF